jgi:ribulose-phosphate 3-epimerase
MLKCSTSLWSADLTDLAGEIRRVDDFTERYHLDVADGHYVPTLLFFPDLVRALRKRTSKPFEVHLMTRDPLQWIAPFVEAGADGIILCHDSMRDRVGTIHRARALARFVGISLLVTERPSFLDHFWTSIDQVTIMGTPMGTKGTSMDPSIPGKIREARTAIERAGAKVEIQVDGGIRRDTVPLIHHAGAAWIVPGSLMFGEDPAAIRKWLASL